MGPSAETKELPKSGGATSDSVESLWQSFWTDPGSETRNLLVEAYQHLVRQVVGRFGARLPRTVDRGDLATAANVGLMSAIENYDPGRGVRFEAYAEVRIRGALLDELRREDWLPRPWRQRIEQRKRAVDELRTRLGRDPRDDEVAGEMAISPADYSFLFGSGIPEAPTGSMPVGDEGERDSSSLEVVPDPRSYVPGEELTRSELLQLVAQRMTAQEYRIVYLKYWEELSMREIGVLTKLSESRVYKIHARLMDRLKDRFRVVAPS